MKRLFLRRNKQTQTVPQKNALDRIALYVPMHVPGNNVPVFLPDISGAVFPSELQCRNGIASALKSTYDSIADAFAPDYEKNIASRLAEYYSMGIERYFHGIHPTMLLYFYDLGKQKQYTRITALVKNSKQDLLLRFQQLLIKKADLYKLYPLNEYVDLALFCETVRNPEHPRDNSSPCRPQPLQYRIVSITEPWNRLQQTKRRLFESYASEAYQIYKDYMFEIQCLL